MKKKIACLHLLNDFSGSPYVFSQAIRKLLKQGAEIDLFTSNSGSKGFLSDIDGVSYHTFFYKWSKNKLLTLIYYLFSQFLLFIHILFNSDKYAAIYINSVLPFGAALAAKIKNKKVIYHIHETSIKPILLKKLLFKVVNFTAKEVIYVSEYLKNQEPLSKPKSHVIYNSLSEDFMQKADYNLNQPLKQDVFDVLMLCSLKAYKGVFEFIELAKKLSQLHFTLVLNASQADIDGFFSKTELPSNLSLFPAQANVHPFYARCSLVLNLSRPDGWIETFGMTVLEAMYYGKPVIVPPVGGVTELVKNDENGFLTDSRDCEQLSRQIKLLSKNARLYHQFAVTSKNRAAFFTEFHFDPNLVF
jgi:glycosyltransferase involved in cell wall biosynthesis